MYTLREDVIVSPQQMRWSERGVQVECAKPPSLNNVGPSLSVPVTSRLAQLPNGLQKAVDLLILLRTRGSPKLCEWQRGIRVSKHRKVAQKSTSCMKLKRKKRKMTWLLRNIRRCQGVAVLL